MKTLSLLIIFFAIAFNACAEDKIFLYGDYYSGMALEEFFRTDPADCEEFPEGEMVCGRENAAFAGLEWQQYFIFRQGALDLVAFGHSASRSAIDHVIAWFKSERYVPITGEAGGKKLNFLLELDKNRQGEFEREYERFNHNLSSASSLDFLLVKQSLLDEVKATGALPARIVVANLQGFSGLDSLYLSFRIFSPNGS